MGRADEGVSHLRRAVTLRPNDPELLSRLVKGLRWAGRQEEAQGELRAARFANPRDRRFQGLWMGFQFRQVRRQQQRLRQQKASLGKGPVLLPFVVGGCEIVPAPRPMTASPEATVPVLRAGRAGRSLDQRNVQ
jgi:hypothetical protein